ncbi:hypothetical protein CC1G_02454 [Coprinopsis cinerea okayama7|uniref:RRM domain-containing protein n=1 Tax=Coprinopsis cinerea (strain Okayama-7 / 130 / ATCC MYA-4618 / FGSC 9003) TaxID=240176 RepID=A8NBJ4_COPC7|nr:hypothetical protein CC1G_02454 [Coprinopsis cinerea okayama7\|eukprot:XP_001832192.1 hypothetical protein CC1G_02454 [Coprinopsis cinerea okayama7\
MNGPDRRHNIYHRTKRQLVGHQVPPAWRPNVMQAAKRAAEDAGSRILISKLPIDVNEQEVEELFKKTVGPVRESFLVYNSQGKSKGMAMVWFVRSGDAAIARAKYDGKIVDGRRPIKIEIIVDGVPGSASTSQVGPAAPAAPPSLLDRMGIKPTAAGPKATSLVQRTNPPGHPLPNQPLVTKLQAQAAARIASGAPPPTAPRAVPPRRPRIRKGPKRLQKKAVTVEDLDKEMEDYRAAIPENGFAMT